MGYKRKYSGEGTGVTASFDVMEIIEGKVYNVLYGGHPNPASTAYALKTITYDVVDIPVIGTANAGNYTMFSTIADAGSWGASKDIDFDSLMGKSLIIDDGDFLISGTIYNNQANVAPTYVVATLYDYDGTTETQIAQTAYDNTKYLDIPGNSAVRFSAIGSISNKYLIKRGHYLRVNLIIYTKTVGAYEFWFFHDPAGTAVTAPAAISRTTFKVHIPFFIGGIYG